MKRLGAALAALTICASMPAAAGAAGLPDPLDRGPYTPTTVETAKLGTVDLQEPSSTGGAPSGATAAATVQLRGSLYYPANRTSGSPVIVIMHGNHSACYQGTAPNCTVFERNDRGYGYMAENLASWGYTVFSIDGDQLTFYQDGNGKGMHQRRLIIAASLDALYRLNQGADADDADHNIGGQLVGKLDFNRIGLMGHSRGGDGVSSFIDFNRTRPAPGRRYTGLRGVIALAPVDYERKAPYGVAFQTVVGYCDGDVSNLQGSRFFERSQYIVDNDPWPRVQMMVHGANHNWFNTTWYADSDDAASTSTNPLFSDPACGSTDTASPTNIRLSGGFYTRSAPGPTQHPGPDTYGSGDPALMGDQEKIGLATMNAFFRRYVGSEVAFDPYMTGELQADGVTPPIPQSACPNQSPGGTRISCFDRVQTTYFAPPSERLDVIRPETDNPLTTSALGTSLTGSGFAYPYTTPGGISPLPAATPGGYDWCNPEPTQFQPSTSTEPGLPTATKGCPLPAATALGGQNATRENAPVNHSYGLQLALAWDTTSTGTPAKIGTTIPAANADVTRFKALAMDAAVNFFDPRNPARTALNGALWNPAGARQDFTIAVSDSLGHTATVSAASPRYGTALSQTVGNNTARVHITLNQIRVPLGDFAAQGVDLTKVRRVELRFGEAGKPQTGSIQLADVHFQELVSGPTAATDAQAAVRSAQLIEDTPRASASDVPDVLWVDTAATKAKGTASCAALPTAALKARKVARGRLTLTGIAKAAACATPAKVKAVEVAVTRKTAGGCRFVTAKGVLGKVLPCSSPVGLVAKGTSRWSMRLPKRLARGRYGVVVRVTDAAGRRSVLKSTSIAIA